MNSQHIRIAVLVISMVAGLWLLYFAADRFYLRERGQLSESIRSAKLELANYESGRKEQKRINTEIQKFVDRTLGADLETVDHMLRTRLNRLAEHVQLQNSVVGTNGANKAKDSPAKGMFGRSPLDRALAAEPDFHELEGWVSGSGTLEQALKLIDSIEAEPWLKRIDQLTLKHKDNGARFTVNIKLTTLYLLKRNPEASAVAAPRAADEGRYATLVKGNPFRLPPAPAPSQATNASPQAPDQPGPFGQWSITGITQTHGNVEIWLLNQKSRESKRMLVGQSFQGLTLLSANPDVAEFQLGDQRFLVSIGKNLNDRLPLN